ncbi:DPY30 domain-containing protein 1 [Histomonas meleagridis]|uniref:DPY30 domain-containing protein 1 n=1 Tax=Histomonas meleagridis TaxID=135588 RepID=UPI00355A566B|nr:DPY30 domain-containing protein 1 [Histomonas meleagridis]KAH0803341.1 DPY30 domain-containing protein 1 [Histomonas meleagridis]
MEDSYLRRVLGDVLVEGLKETALEDPTDPIDFLAKWLLHHQDAEDQWNSFREEQKQLSISKAEYMANLEAEYQAIEEERRLREEEEKKRIEEEEKRRIEEEKAKKKAEEEEEEDKDENTEENDTSVIYSESLSEAY